jgi:Copper transport outer membrane protein, MctB
MFDFRYHALSLVAVFMALVIGILLGIAIGDKGLLSSARREVERSLRNDLRHASSKADRLQADVAQHTRLERDLYPLVVQGRLSGQRVGLIALGKLSDYQIGLVRNALKDTGGRLVLEAVISQPPDVDRIPAADSGVRGQPLSSDARAINRFARRFGVALTSGGPLLKRTRRVVFATSSGAYNGLDSIIVIRTDPAGLTDGQATVNRAFENGLMAGLGVGNDPIVGTETTSTDPSMVTWYRRHGLSSVDNLNQLPGQVSLVFALAGANGAYGIKPTAQALLPKAASGAGSG